MDRKLIDALFITENLKPNDMFIRNDLRKHVEQLNLMCLKKHLKNQTRGKVHL